MTMQTIPGGLGDLRRAGAGTGVSLSTTVARTFIPRGTKYVGLIPRNFSTAVAVYYCVNPWLTVLKTSDLFADIANCTDYSQNAQDDNTATDVTLSSLDTLANLDALLLGSHMPFAGFHCDMDAANGNASVIAAHYWKSDNTWATLSPTDGTTTGGATFGQDGAVTWTVPTDWRMARLRGDIYTSGDPRMGWEMPQYWVRVTVSAALDASTTLNHILSIARADNYATLISGGSIEFAVSTGAVGGYASIDALTDAGTANLQITTGGGYRAG